MAFVQIGIKNKKNVMFCWFGLVDCAKKTAVNYMNHWQSCQIFKKYNCCLNFIRLWKYVHIPKYVISIISLDQAARSWFFDDAKKLGKNDCVVLHDILLRKVTSRARVALLKFHCAFSRQSSRNFWSYWFFQFVLRNIHNILHQRTKSKISSYFELLSSTMVVFKCKPTLCKHDWFKSRNILWKRNCFKDTNQVSITINQ